MPRFSERRALLREITDAVTIAMQDEMEEMEGDDSSSDDSSSSDSSDSSSDEELDEVGDLTELLITVQSSRHLSQRARFEKSKDFVQSYFQNLPDKEWKQMMRTSLESFNYIVGQIENDAVFHNNSHVPQAPVWLQLAVTLDRLGNYGNGASFCRTMLIWGMAQEPLTNTLAALSKQ